jgi:hypothetical protein
LHGTSKYLLAVPRQPDNVEVMKALRARDFWTLLLCSAPVAALAAFPALKAAVFPPFRLTLDEVHIAQTANNTHAPDARSYIATVYVSHTGPRPEWWGKREGVRHSPSFPPGGYTRSTGMEADVTNARLIDAKGKVHKCDSVSAMLQLFDDASGRYVVHIEPDFDKAARINGSRFLVDITTAHGPLQVNVPARLSPPLNNR